MEDIHKVFSNKYPWYRRWHQYRLSSATHWSMLAIVVLAMGGLLIYASFSTSLMYRGITGFLRPSPTLKPLGPNARSDYKTKKEIKYVPGQLIVKLKEGRDINHLRNLNIKYQVTSPKKVFKEKLSPQAVLQDLRGQLYQIEIQGQIEQLPNIEQLKKRIKAQEKLITRLEQRKRRAPKNISPPNLENIYLIETKKDANMFKLAAEYTQNPNVEYAEPNYIYKTQLVPNDPYYSFYGSWGQSYDDLWGLKKIQTETAWDMAQGQGTIVAVVDTGIDYNHQEIANNLWINQGEILNNGLDDDNNGYLDDYLGYDFFNSDNDPYDGHGHGTHVAGTIAALGNNNMGIIGVAPQVKVMALKGLSDDGWGTDTELADALKYAANNGADVINNSWGGWGTSQLIEDAVNYAYSQGCVVVAAAGNSDMDVANFIPAGFDNVIAVASTDHNDQKSDFSNFGAKIDVAAPGGDSDDNTPGRIYQNILSLRADQIDMYGDGINIVGTNYYRARGTSMASPHVAGLAALILSKNPNFSNEEVRQIIKASSDDIGSPGFDFYSGYGRINATRALQMDSACIAKITFPEENSMFKSGVEIRGSAYGANFTSYKLEYAYSLEGGWIQIGSISYSPVIDGLLGYLNLSDDTYYLRLTVNDINGYHFQDIVGPVVLDNRLHNGWPIKVEGYPEDGSILYFPRIYDFDNDGNQEIVVVGWENIWVYNSDGTLLAGWPQTGFGDYMGTFHGAPAIGDVDNDGMAEIIIGAIEGIIRYEINGQGEYHHFDYEVEKVILSDIDGDEQLEMILGYDKFENYKGIYVLNILKYDNNLNTFVPLAGWPVQMTDEADGVYSTEDPVVGDVDNDGNLEIVCQITTRKASPYMGSGDIPEIYIFDKDGQIEERFPLAPNIDSIDPDGGLVLADLDLDGDLEIGFAYSYYQSVILKHLHFVHHNGADVEGWPYRYENLTQLFYNSEAPVIGDLNKDSSPEVISWRYSSWNNQSLLVVLDANGNKLAGWPVYFNQDPSLTAALIGDVNGDQEPDIIMPTGSDWANSETKRDIFIFNKEGQEIARPLRFAATPLWKPIGATLGDIDNDGKVEIVAVSTEGMVSVWDLDGQYDELTMEWPTFRHDPQNTGLYPSSPFAPPTIPGDITGDRKVDSQDYTQLMSKWGQTTDINREDLNDDGVVDVRDLGIIMSNWKPE